MEARPASTKTFTLLAGLLLASCDNKPKHYYVFCEDRDEASWKLIAAEKNEDGYLVACTFQSPDGMNSSPPGVRTMAAIDLSANMIVHSSEFRRALRT